MSPSPAESPSVPESLLGTGLQPVWAKVRNHLDKHGPERRGSIALPDLDPGSELTLRSMLGKVNKRLDLISLENALVERAVGRDLSVALVRLGHPPSAEAAQRRRVRDRSAEARTALRDAIDSWPEPWASDWAEGLISAGLIGGLGSDEVEPLVRDVRRLLDHLDQHEPTDPLIRHAGDGQVHGRSPGPSEPPFTSRTELAAALFGSAHALDTGTRLAAFASRALRCELGADLEGRSLWEAAGIQPDRVSAPALVWAVPVTGHSPLDEALMAARRGGLPLHVSLFAMLSHPVAVLAGTSVLVVENPRLVEAAAERRLPICVVAANGNPATAVTTLLGQLQQSGAAVRYHGDFDSAGIAICRRMHELGCTPWAMDADDYRAAVRRAEQAGVPLERDSRECGATPWDPALEPAFNARRLIVHEEFLLDDVLGGFHRLVLGVGSTDR